MSFDHVDVLDIEQVGPIVTLTLRRPEVRNALNAALRRAIRIFLSSIPMRCQPRLISISFPLAWSECVAVGGA